MRDIKFEIIWEDLKEKRQKQIVTLDNLLLGAWELPSDRLTTIARRQYTGFEDKKGKEIYEGDILKYQHNKITSFHRVIWLEKKAAFGYMVEDKKRVFVRKKSEWDNSRFEIIGNICEKQGGKR